MKQARRVTLVAIVFLLIGAAVNVGVAWGCVARADIMGAPDWKPEPPWPRAVPERWPAALWVMSSQGFGWRTDTVFGRGLSVESHGRVFRDVSITTNRAGWPFKALQWERWSDLYTVFVGGQQPRKMREHEGLPSSTWRCGLDYPFRTGPGRAVAWKALPLRPAWPGFAINTLLYAALAAVLWYGPGAARCAMRCRRNQCLSCGYSRAGLAMEALCPECGNDKDRRVRATLTRAAAPQSDPGSPPAPRDTGRR